MKFLLIAIGVLVVLIYLTYGKMLSACIKIFVLYIERNIYYITLHI
jgi:hypothetical protein